MDLLKQLLVYAAVLIVLWLVVTQVLPMLSRAQMSPDYIEISIPDVEHYKSYNVEKNVPMNRLVAGQAVCYQLPTGEGANANGFGYVAAIPGDLVEFAGAQLLVNGAPCKNSGPLANRPNAGGLVVPENHVYVVTTTHTTDSVARGPLPADSIRGRIAEFP